MKNKDIFNSLGIELINQEKEFILKETTFFYKTFDSFLEKLSINFNSIPEANFPFVFKTNSLTLRSDNEGEKNEKINSLNNFKNNFFILKN